MRLENRFSLIVTGQISHSSATEIPEVLRKVLPQRFTDIKSLVAQAPLKLVQHRERQRLIPLQNRLTDAGISSRIDGETVYRGLLIPQSLIQALQQSTDDDTSALQSFALLHVHPQPDSSQLQAICKACNHNQAHILSRRTVLLAMPAPGRDGAGQQLRDIRQHALATLTAADAATSWRIQMSFALWPEDGQSLTALIDTLIQRLQMHLQDNHLDNSFKHSPAISGYGFGRLLQLGRQPSENDGLSPEEAHYLEDFWPIEELWPCADDDPARRRKIQQVMTRYKDAEEDRRLRGSVILQNLAGADNLPTLPELTQKIIAMTQDPELDVQALVALVKSDPGLSARLLSIVNSAGYGLRQDIESVEHGVIILGFEEISHLAMSLSSQSLFERVGTEEGQRLWRHASLTANFAAGLARKLELPRAQLFTAALLHDVGHIALQELSGDGYNEVRIRSARAQLPSYEIERELFGFDHAQAGAFILRRWGLPESICLSVEQHHGPSSGEQAMTASAALIGVADYLAHETSQAQAQSQQTRLRRCHAAALQPSLKNIHAELGDLLNPTATAATAMRGAA